MNAVDHYLPQHREFLQKNYAEGTFPMSGRRDPRKGCVIIARADSEEATSVIIADDHFHQNGIADYEAINFQPSMTSDDLAMFREDLNS